MGAYESDCIHSEIKKDFNLTRTSAIVENTHTNIHTSNSFSDFIRIRGLPAIRGLKGLTFLSLPLVFQDAPKSYPLSKAEISNTET